MKPAGLIRRMFTLLKASLAAAPFLLPGPALAAPNTFSVNSTADIPDSTPGDGVCETALHNGVCTLRGAILEANAKADADVVTLQAGVTYLLTQVGSDTVGGDLDITQSVTIVGAGASSTIIDGNSLVTSDRVLQVFQGATVNISGVTLRNGVQNLLLALGGGVWNGGTLTFTDTIVSGNTAIGFDGAAGGGIYNLGTLTLINCRVQDNHATGIGSEGPSGGGGIYNEAIGLLTLDRTTVSGNTATNSGGGIVGQAALSNSTVSGNISYAGVGGGIYKPGGTLTLINSTVSRNTARGGGGGIYNWTGTASLFNSTIAENHANTEAVDGQGGGGVLNVSGGTLTFLNTIIGSNTITIVAGSFLVDTLDDCWGIITSQGNSIVQTHDVSYCTVNGPVTFASPRLGPLQDNGGPTQTNALLTGSPAIDAGTAGGCTDNLGATLTIDQRGLPRPLPYGARCDIGAYEASGFRDDPLIAGATVIRGQHITELRARIDAQRIRYGLGGFGWSNVPLTAGLPVLASHIGELRAALQEAYAQAGRPQPGFTDPTLVPGTTSIRTIHIQELRSATIALEGG